MTRREKLEKRLERRLEWAESRTKKSNEEYEKSNTLVKHIPVGQPILLGHHSENRHRKTLGRAQQAASKSVEHYNMAKYHENKATEIDRILDKSIFSDDEDVIIKLQERINEREAECEAIKKYNASCRSGNPDLSILNESQKSELESVLKYAPYQSKGGQFPSYALSNLRSRINADKKKLSQLSRKGA